MTEQYPRISSKNATPGQRVRSIPRDGQKGAQWEGTVMSKAYRTAKDELKYGARAQYYVDILRDGETSARAEHCQYMFIIQEAPVEA